MNYKNILLAIGVVMVFSGLADAQQTVTDTVPVDPNEIPVLPGDEVEVLKDFKARLAETQMIKILPELPIHRVTTIPYSYEVNVRGLSLDYLPPIIRPVALPREVGKESYNSMIQFAYGYPRLSQAKAEIYYAINDKLDVGLRYDHLAAKNKERSPASFYRHDGQVYSRYLLNDNIQLNAEFNVALDRHYLKDRITETANDKRDTRLYGLQLGIQHPHVDESTVDYNFLIGYEGMVIDFLDHADIDSRFFTEAFVEKRMGAIGIGLGVDYNYVYFDEESTSVSDTTYSLNQLELSPKISYNTDIWNVSAGADLLWENGDLNVLPQVELMYAVAGSKLHAGVFAKTDVILQSITAIQQYNPFFGHLNQILNEKTQKYGAKITGSFDRYEFAVEAGYKSSKDLMSFREANGQLDDYKNIRWVGEQVDATSIFTDIAASYKISSTVKLLGELQYQNYKDSLDNDIAGTYDVAWGIGAEINLLENKLKISPSFDMMMNLERGYEYDHNSINDLSIDIDYRVQKHLSVYVKTYNLLNNQNERWAGYPSLGIGIAGGLSLRF